MDNITELFIKEPEREFHIREIAKIIKKSPTTVSKYAYELKKMGLLRSKNISNHILFKSNNENSQFKAIKRNYNLKNISSSGLTTHLEEELNPEAIILFGSFAKGEDIPKSDIDIAIITPSKKESNLENFEKKLKHNIQLFLYSKKDIEEMKKKNKELLNNLINGTVIYGFWEVFRWNLKIS